MDNFYAFWRHDHFPYLLGGTVTKMDERGRVQTDQYGVGSWFCPVKILPLRAGLALHAKLRAATEDYRLAQARLHVAAMAEIVALVPEVEKV